MDSDRGMVDARMVDVTSYGAVAWHDDAPDPTASALPAALPLPAHVDWLVIGGGVSGLSAARRAAERGASVLLLEKGSLRDGASSRNGGMVHVGFGASISQTIGSITG